MWPHRDRQWKNAVLAEHCWYHVLSALHCLAESEGSSLIRSKVIF